MKESLKKGSISDNLKTVKSKDAAAEGIKDFFSMRDKSRRGTIGLVDDTSKILAEEIETKQSLYEKSLEVSSLPEHIKPLSNKVFLTARRNKLTENGLYLPTASFGSNGDTDLEVDFSDKQIVLATGAHASQVAKGMEVVLDMEQFKRRLSDTMAQRVNKEFAYEIPVKVIDGVEYIYVSEREISYISNTNGVEVKKD